MSTLQLFRRHRKPLGGALAALMAFWQVGQPLQAADTVWDNSDNDFSWDNANNWSLGAPTLTDTAILPFTIPGAGPITLGASSTANLVSFKNDYSLTGGTLTLGAGGLRADLGVSSSIGSVLAGSSGLTMTGGGSVRLTNTAPTYTGATTIANGSLIISDPAALGGTGTVLIRTTNNTPLNNNLIGFGGGSLVLDGTAGGFTFARDIDFEGRGPIGDRGAAIQSLGNNTLSGTLRSAISNLPPSPTASIRNSRINSVNGTLTLSGTLNAGGTAAATFTTLGGVNSGGVGNFSFGGVGTLTGTGSIDKAGGGTLFLNSALSNAGFAGTVRISGSAGEGAQSSVRITSATIGANNVFGTNAGTTNASTIDMRGGLIEFRNEGNLNIAKNVYQNNSSTYYTGPGVGGAGVNGTTTLGTFRLAANTTATFNSRNGYGITLGAWTQESDNNNNTITNNMGGTLLFTGNAWNNANGTARTLTFGGGGITTINGFINTNNAITQVLTKADGGLLTIVGQGTSTLGNVNVTGGALAITDFRSINNTLTNRISLGNATTTGGTLIIGTGTTPTAAGLTTSRGILLNVTAATNSIWASQPGANPVILNGAITKTVAGVSTLSLGGTNTASNAVNVSIPDGPVTGATTLTAAATSGATTLTLNTVTGLTVGAALTGTGVAPGTTITAINPLTKVVTLSAAITANIANAATVSSTNLVGVTSVNKVGSGTWALGATNGYTGTTTISNGRLALQANAAASNILDDNSTIVFTQLNGLAGGTLEYRGQDSTTNTETIGRLQTPEGSNTLRLTPGASGTASLTISQLDAPGGGGVLNIVGADFVNNTVTVVGANGLVNRGFYFNGSDFAYRDTNKLRAPVYGTDAGFSTTTTAMTAAANQEVTGAGFSQGALTVNTLKLSGSPNVALTGALTVTTRGILATGGTSTLSGAGALALTTTTSVIRVNGSTDSLTISAPITGTTAGISKNGAGTLILSGTNSTTGTFTINEGTVQLGAATGLGGARALTVRQGGLLDLNGFTPANNINAFANMGRVVNAGAMATLTVGGADGGGTSYGTIEGNINVTKIGTAAQAWYSDSTYTGITTLGSTGSIRVDTLANGGVASGIGQSGSGAANLVITGAPTLRYDGGIRVDAVQFASKSSATDRLFTLASTATGFTLESNVSNGNAMVWSNTGAIVNNTAANATLTLNGAANGDNTFNPLLSDSSVGGGVTLSLTKSGAAQWNLGNSGNAYTGTTTVADGILGLNDNAALPANSPLVLGAAATSGILQTSGNFARTLTATPAAGTGTITFGGTTGGGGFAAHTDALTVTLNGGAGLTWGSGGFVPTGAPILLNSGSALSSVNFTNAIDLGAVARTITVADNVNTGADFAQLSGLLSGAGGSIVKTGGGILKLTGANTYTGSTTVQDGTLVVSSLGLSTSPGATSVGDSTLGNTAAGALILGNGGNSAAALQYVGAGETSDRLIRLNSTNGTSSTNQIHADGSGPLILTNLVNDVQAAAGETKTLALRGSNAQNNMITSQLTNGGAGTGTLSVTVDGGATWILTNATNSFSGNLTASGGALGIADPLALGLGGLVNNNGNIFAYGADRTVSNVLTLSNNATNGWLGDYSLNFSNPTNLAAAANNVTTTNNIVAGKTLTLNGVTANALTANRAWAIDGAGETVINGDFTTSTAFGVRFDVNGGATLNLGTNGATSNWNQTITAVEVDRGTLKFSANNAIPTSATTTGGVVMSPELATNDVATIDLNGTNQTINGFTSSTDGTAVVDNSAATPSIFTFGANDQAVNFGTGVGTYSITDSGSSTLSLVKTGTGAGLIAPGVTLNYSGTTSVNGGTFTIASPLNGTTGLSATGTSILALSGGFTTTTPVTSVTVGDQATLSLLDGTGTKLTNLTNLTLGTAAGTITTLNFNVGDLSLAGDNLNTDTLSLASGTLSLFTGNTISFNITDTGLNPNQQYVLLDSTAIGGGFFGGASPHATIAAYVLGSVPGGFASIDLTTNSTTNQIILTTGNLITGNSWWNAGGTLDNWSDVANWAITNKDGLTAAASIPGQGTDVVFIADNIAGGGAITTTLEQNFKVNSLTFEASTTPADTPASVTVAPGAIATNRLEIAPQLATDGIKITAGGSPSVTISAPVRLGANQTWNVADATSTLTLSGALQGEKDVTKTGLGKVTLSAAADVLFNAGLTTDVTVSSGTLELTNAGALGATLTSNAANVSIGTGGAFYYNNGTSGTVNNPLTLSGGTLSVGGNNQTYSGAVNVSNASTVNLADLNGPTTNTGRNITLSGQLTGTGKVTINSNDTVAAGNQINGNLIPTNADNSGFSGGFDILRGTLLLRNASAAGTGPINVQFGRVEWESAVGSGTIYNVSNNLSIFRTGGNAVAEWNVDRTGGAGSFSVVHNGTISLGGAGVGETGELRVFLQDNPDTSATFDGNVTLAGNSAIHVRDNATGAVGTFNGVISGAGSLTLNGPAPAGTAWGGTAGIVVLNGVNTYLGGTSLAGGTVRLGTKDAFGAVAGAVTVTGGTTVQALADLSGVNAVANATTLNAGLTVSGTNNLTLSGTFTGTGGDANRTLTNSLTGPAALALSGGVNLGAGANTAARTLTVAGAGNTTISGVIANGNAFANGLTKTGAGTLTLSNTNTYTGTTTISPGSGNTYGVILATATDALGTGPVSAIFTTGATSGQIQLSGGITLGNSSFTTSGPGSDGTNSGIIRSVSGANIISGPVNMTGGGGASTYRADTGASLTFDGNVGGVGANPTRTVNLVGGGDFIFNGVIQNSNDATASTVGLNSANTGTTTLNNANTYTLGTTVASGSTLLVNNTTGSGTGTGAVTVAAGGTLGGSGIISGATTISGTHSPGNSPGIQTFGGNLSYTDAAVNWELFGNTSTTINPAARGTTFGWDGIDVGGALSFTNTSFNLSFGTSPSSLVSWNDLLWTSNQSWLIYSGATSLSGLPALNIINWDDAAGLDFDGIGTFSLASVGNNVVLNYTAIIPEPSRAMLMLLGLLSLGFRRRRNGF